MYPIALFKSIRPLYWGPTLEPYRNNVGSRLAKSCAMPLSLEEIGVARAQAVELEKRTMSAS